MLCCPHAGRLAPHRRRVRGGGGKHEAAALTLTLALTTVPVPSPSPDPSPDPDPKMTLGLSLTLPGRREAVERRERAGLGGLLHAGRAQDVHRARRPQVGAQGTSAPASPLASASPPASALAPAPAPALAPASVSVSASTSASASVSAVLRPYTSPGWRARTTHSSGVRVRMMLQMMLTV